VPSLVVVSICAYTAELGKRTVFMLRSVVCCRSHAIACVNQFIISRTEVLMLHIDSFIEVCIDTLSVNRLIEHSQDISSGEVYSS